MQGDDFERGYVCGVVDTEASFSVSVKIQHDLRCKVRLDPVFSITQQNRSVLEIIKKNLDCGRILPKPQQKHLWILVVDELGELKSKLIPKLDKFKLVAKKKQYSLFREIVLKLAEKKYALTCKDIRALVILSYKLSMLNSKSHRKRSLDEILALIP